MKYSVPIAALCSGRREGGKEDISWMKITLALCSIHPSKVLIRALGVALQEWGNEHTGPKFDMFFLSELGDFTWK